MTEKRVREIVDALQGTKGDPEFSTRWLELQPDILVLNCTASAHPELTGPSSPYVLVLFCGEEDDEGVLAVMPHAPADRAAEWHCRIEAAL
jgi:hypothetical protein